MYLQVLVKAVFILLSLGVRYRTLTVPLADINPYDFRGYQKNGTDGVLRFDIVSNQQSAGV